MAAQTCVHTQHATLSSTTADSITFSGTGTTLCITNRDASDIVYFRFDGTTAVAAADETYVVLPNNFKTIQMHSMGGLVVSVVGDGGAYSAELF
jgi:hypothetical protein